jgi:hypothetical protein
LCLPGMHVVRHHQRHSTRHPPHEQLLMGLEVGGVLWCWGLRGSFLSFGCAGVGIGAGIIAGSSWWGPWCSFLIIVSAHHHPLTLPNLQAGACSGGNGWWVGVFCFRGFEHVSDMACLWGSLGAYRAGIPLLGSLCTLLACVDRFTSRFNGDGDWVVVCVHVCRAFSVVVGCR